MTTLSMILKLLFFLVLPLAACYLEYLYGFVWPQCHFVPEMADAVSQSLERIIGGQKRALDTITSSIAGWEFRRKSGNVDPLVLAISGPPGVGKSETGFRIAEAIFGKSTTIGMSRAKPTGLLTIAGGDFACGVEGDVAEAEEIRQRMKSLIINHLRACSGNAMIIFDEVQKVAPGALEILRSGLKERGSFTTATGVSISTVNTIFLFISDIGASQLQNLLLLHEDRDAIPIQTIQIEMKNALDEQWKRLRFGETIRNVIPFLPMELPQIEAVFRLKLKSIARRQRHIFWANLIVEDSLINHLSGTKSILYRNVTSSFTGPLGNTFTRSKLFAKGGARSVENGPLSALEGLLHQYMQPWRPDQVAHVGIVESSDDTRHQWNKIRLNWAQDSVHGTGSTGTEPVQGFVKKTEVYFQWCALQEEMVGPHPVISMETTLSKTCETKWFSYDL